MVSTIDEADLPALEQAITNLNSSLSDLADIVDDIVIPGLATEQQSGLLAADDRAKLNRLTVSAQTNIDEIKSKMDMITLTNAIDLDQLKVDVEELKNESNGGESE